MLPCVYGVAKRAHEWHSLALADLSSAGLAHQAAAPGAVTLATLAALWQLDVLEGLDHVRPSHGAATSLVAELTWRVRVSPCAGSPQARARSSRLRRALWRGLAGAGRWRSQLVATAAAADPDTWRPWHGGAEWTAADYLWSPVPVQEVRRNDVPAILACGPAFEVEFAYVVGGRRHGASRCPR